MDSPTLERLAKVWAPQPGPQTAALECPVEDILFGGAKGGGKTDWLIGDWLKHADLYGKHAHGVLFRRTYKQLAEVMRRCAALFPKIGAYWRGGEYKAWFFPNGALLELRYLDSDADAEQYEGHEFTWEGFDEVGDWTSPSGIDRLRSRLRSVYGVPCVSRLTANPKGRGHAWLKRRYITPAKPMVPFFDEEKEVQRVFIPSRLQDNKLLTENDQNYIRRLRGSGTPRMVKAWLEGDWSDDLDGGLFDVEKIEANRLDMTAAQLIQRLGLRPTQYWDLATKEKQLYKKDPGHEPDNSACLTVARDEMDRFILLHGWAAQVGSEKLLRQMHALQARFRCPVKAEKGAIANVLMGVMPMMNKILGRDFHIIPIGKGAIDKVQHSVPAQMLVNSGNVYLASDCDTWWPAMKEELRAFPHIAADIKDDRVDTLSYAAEDLRRTPAADPPRGHFKLPRELTLSEVEAIMEQAGGEPADDESMSAADWWTE